MSSCYRLTIAPTIRSTSGSTRRRIGNATTQELAQALSHAETTPGASPTFRAVDTPETMQDITMDVSNSATKVL
jgi:hypothetical protein